MPYGMQKSLRETMYNIERLSQSEEERAFRERQFEAQQKRQEEAMSMEKEAMKRSRLTQNMNNIFNIARTFGGEAAVDAWNKNPELIEKYGTYTFESQPAQDEIRLKDDATGRPFIFNLTTGQAREVELPPTFKVKEGNDISPTKIFTEIRDIKKSIGTLRGNIIEGMNLGILDNASIKKYNTEIRRRIAEINRLAEEHSLPSEKIEKVNDWLLSEEKVGDRLFPEKESTEKNKSTSLWDIITGSKI